MSTSSREFSAGVQLRTEGDFVVPAAPDDADPGACEDSNGVRVPTSTGARPLVDLHRPLVAEAAAVREIHDRPAEFLVARPAEHGLSVFAGLPSRG